MKLENIELEFNRKDHPDYAYAIIIYAERDGVALTEEELDELNQDSELVHELVLEEV